MVGGVAVDVPADREPGDAARVELSPDAFDRLRLSVGDAMVLVATDRDVFVVSDDGAVNAGTVAPPAAVRA